MIPLSPPPLLFIVVLVDCVEMMGDGRDDEVWKGEMRDELGLGVGRGRGRGNVMRVWGAIKYGRANMEANMEGN